MVPPVDHDCVLKDIVIEQSNEIAQLKLQVERLTATVLGSRSEKSKLPRPGPKTPSTPEQRQETRRANAAAKAEAPTVTVTHKVPDEDRHCTACGGDKLTPLGEGKKTTVWEFVPARFVRVVHVQEVLRCRCNGCVSLAAQASRMAHVQARKKTLDPAHLSILDLSSCPLPTPCVHGRLGDCSGE